MGGLMSSVYRSLMSTSRRDGAVNPATRVFKNELWPSYLKDVNFGSMKRFWVLVGCVVWLVRETTFNPRWRREGTSCKWESCDIAWPSSMQNPKSREVRADTEERSRDMDGRVMLCSDRCAIEDLVPLEMYLGSPHQHHIVRFHGEF